MATTRDMLRGTLPIDPESQWLLRREMLGLTRTLPTNAEAQAALEQLRREVVAVAYSKLDRG